MSMADPEISSASADNVSIGVAPESGAVVFAVDVPQGGVLVLQMTPGETGDLIAALTEAMKRAGSTQVVRAGKGRSE